MPRPIVALTLLPCLVASACQEIFLDDDALVSVTVSGGGDGNGRVRAPHAQILVDCPVTDGVAVGYACSDQFADAGLGGTFELVATADPGHLFVGWGEDCSGTAPRCYLTFATSGDSLEAEASFLRIPSSIEVTVDATLELGQSITATAVASPAGLSIDQFTWASSDPTVLAVTPNSPSSTATVTAVAEGSAEITAEARTRASDPVTIAVTGIPVTYTATRFAWVETPVLIDFDSDGQLYVGNNDNSGQDYLSHVRRIDENGYTSSFGPKVSDPDGVLVDREGRFGDRNAVLTAGTYDAQFSNNHVTSIHSDGSGLNVIIEAGPPLLANPGSMAFLDNGDLLIGNHEIVSVLRRAEGVLEGFYGHPLGALVARNDTVFGIRPSLGIVMLDETGEVLEENLWPWTEAGDPVPAALTIDLSGQWLGEGLVAADSEGHVHRMDMATGQWTTLAGVHFTTSPVFGLAVHPVAGDLYVAEREGQIWKVTKD